MKILGREPVLILGFIAVALKLSAAYGLDVSNTQQTLINTVLSCLVAVASAWILRNGAIGAAIMQFASAALALFVGFGLDLSAEEQAGWMALVAAALAILERPQVVPPISILPLEQKGPQPLAVAA
ncbi:hypothetical protein [Streptomyces cucumeris]|uniref:hypothetical protein n=1 Tax=Streptomyces cucumeris TaxID=2962890 RepID=UPI0020C853FF|nr:hypothetical protein [Streptomyces sp. NEAU-Y11]MCP9209668.1 hypothetical protein [Streptomyces sp. NEAU-Y11]